MSGVLACSCSAPVNLTSQKDTHFATSTYQGHILVRRAAVQERASQTFQCLHHNHTQGAAVCVSVGNNGNSPPKTQAARATPACILCKGMPTERHALRGWVPAQTSVALPSTRQYSAAMLRATHDVAFFSKARRVRSPTSSIGSGGGRFAGGLPSACLGLQRSQKKNTWVLIRAQTAKMPKYAPTSSPRASKQGEGVGGGEQDNKTNESAW